MEQYGCFASFVAFLYSKSWNSEQHNLQKHLPSLLSIAQSLLISSLTGENTGENVPHLLTASKSHRSLNSPLLQTLRSTIPFLLHPMDTIGKCCFNSFVHLLALQVTKVHNIDSPSFSTWKQDTYCVS